jgi:hypothetical protein
LRVKFATTVSTLGGRYLKETIHEVSAPLGEQWIKNGWAEKVKPSRAKKPRSKVI